MPTKSQSVPRINQQHRITLSPIKKSKKKKILQEKQKKFVLDCTNHQKAKLQEYNYLKDKYLNYCIVKVPRKKRLIMNATNQSHNQTRQQKSIKSPVGFKNFLQSKRQQILAQTQLLKKQKENNFFKNQNEGGSFENVSRKYKNQDEKQNNTGFDTSYG